MQHKSNQIYTKNTKVINRRIQTISTSSGSCRTPNSTGKPAMEKNKLCYGQLKPKISLDNQHVLTHFSKSHLGRMTFCNNRLELSHSISSIFGQFTITYTIKQAFNITTIDIRKVHQPWNMNKSYRQLNKIVT